MEPYKNRQQEYTEARRLRLLGFGYGTIAKNINVSWRTVANWVADLPRPNKAEAIRKGQPKKDFTTLVTKRAIRDRLVLERGHRCEQCRRRRWNGLLIMLEVHHLIGKSNKRQNLKLLCPNCHSQTESWRGRKASVV